MFRNYLKVAWRNMTRNKGYSFINIFGLTVGLAIALLTVGYQAIRAARANPIESLRYE